MKVVVLTDERIGSSKQSKALASLLNFEYTEVKLEYTFWSKSPNFMPFALQTISFDSRQKVRDLLKEENLLIIAAGRRLARISNYIKAHGVSVKNIQILKPDLPYKNFDVITLPRHDVKNPELAHDNLVIFDGAITKPETLSSKEKEDWRKKFAELPKKKIVLLIGGETRHSVFMEHHARFLVKKALKLATECEAALLVSNSRRTGDRLTHIIFQTIKRSKTPCLLHDVTKNGQNPYKAFLSFGDYFITTGDSISMVAECIATDKPVFIYSSEGMLSHKHHKYIKWLFRKEYAYPLQAKLPELSKSKNKIDKLFRDQILERLKA